MASLIGASRMINNQSMKDRISAAVRQTAPAKAPVPGPAGLMAAQAMIDPSSLVPHFLSRVAVDIPVAQKACVDCGYAAADDATILFIVDSSWDEVADVVFPNLS